MKLRSIARILFVLLSLTFGGGCATQALWDNGSLEAVNEPASNLNLRLFAAKRHNELLVVYDEYSERHDGIHTRAYWLNENQGRVDQRRAPHFASPRVMCNLSPVPVFYSVSGEPNWTMGRYAVVATNRQSFTLHASDGTTSRHDLPTYNDGKGRMEKITLTPVAVTLDLTIVGGFLFLLAWSEGCWSDIH